MREQTPKEMVAAYERLTTYLAHLPGCEIEHTDFCTCGLTSQKFGAKLDVFVAALSARCTALEQEHKERPDSPATSASRRGARGNRSSPIRCQHLQEEVERRNITVVEQHVAKALMDQVHRAEAAEAALDTATANALALNDLCASHIEEKINLRSRCQHLEQAVKDVRTMVERWRKRVDSFSQAAHPQIRDAAGWVSGCANEIDEALSALPSSQDETDDQTRAGFSAGYTQALTDITGAK